MWGLVQNTQIGWFEMMHSPARMRRKFLLGLLGLVMLVGVLCGYCYVHWVGYPQRIEGRWLRPRIMQWYWTGMPGWPYPAAIQYGYRGPEGRFVPHGPYIRRKWNFGGLPGGNGLVVEETGYYTEGQKNGVFMEYQTYWGRPMSRKYYERGKLVREQFLESVP